MKKFTVLISGFLAFLLFFSSVGSNIVLAKEMYNDDEQLIDDAIHGEDFDWSNVEWEEIDVEYNNDEFVEFEDDDLEEQEYEYIDLADGEDYESEYDFIIINEDDPSFKEPEFQPYVWGLIARVVMSGGKHVVKFGSKIFKKQPKSKAVNHTKNFKAAKVNLGKNKTVVLQRSSMNHILHMHHPKYWTGAIDKTLFNPNISSGKIRAQIIQILNKNKSQIKNGYGTINVKIDGQKYRLVVKNYRVTTFYPLK
ncbi:MAG TPA: hypothetical protein DEO65_04300 [Bacillus bacterium]|uniref:hypothetical protein n=1 Tax=Siminovitchia fordii TaxID=254759 RepID=UPI000368777C|nr:hypothetical protein [Siminovitchia fordii]HBZ09096.1 hypothetical protein [Bacillus sp. (in: firmicutes)]